VGAEAPKVENLVRCCSIVTVFHLAGVTVYIMVKYG